MAMSEHIKEQLAWVSRIIMIIGMGIVSTVGISVYNTVNEVHILVKVQDNKIEHLEQADIRHEKKHSELDLDLKEVKADFAELRTTINTKHYEQVYHDQSQKMPPYR